MGKKGKGAGGTTESRSGKVVPSPHCHDGDIEGRPPAELDVSARSLFTHSSPCLAAFVPRHCIATSILKARSYQGTSFDQHHGHTRGRLYRDIPALPGQSLTRYSYTPTHLCYFIFCCELRRKICGGGNSKGKFEVTPDSPDTNTLHARS